MSNGTTERHRENALLRDAGLVSSQREADQLRKEIHEEGLCVEDYIVREKNTIKRSTPPNPKPLERGEPETTSHGYNSSLSGAEDGDIHVHLKLRPKGGERIDENLIRTWLETQFSNPGLCNVEIEGIKPH